MNSCCAKSVVMCVRCITMAEREWIKGKGNDDRRRIRRIHLCKRKECEEKMKGNERAIEGFLFWTIAQDHGNCIKNKICSKMDLGFLEDDFNFLPGSSGVLSLPENHTRNNSCKMFVLNFISYITIEPISVLNGPYLPWLLSRSSCKYDHGNARQEKTVWLRVSCLS